MKADLGDESEEEQDIKATNLPLHLSSGDANLAVTKNIATLSLVASEMCFNSEETSLIVAGFNSYIQKLDTDKLKSIIKSERAVNCLALEKGKSDHFYLHDVSSQKLLIMDDELNVIKEIVGEETSLGIKILIGKVRERHYSTMKRKK